MGSRVSLPTGRTSFSVISAKARAALRCKSTLSEKESVVNAESGAPWKKLVVVRSARDSSERNKIGDRVHLVLTLKKLEEIRYGLALVLQQ